MKTRLVVALWIAVFALSCSAKLHAAGSISAGGFSGTYTWDGTTLSVTGTLSQAYPASGGGDAWGVNTWHLGAAAAPFWNAGNGAFGSQTFTLSPFVVGDQFHVTLYSTNNGTVATYKKHESWHTLTVDVATENKVRISLPINKSDKAKTYKLIQDGVELGTVVLEPGQGLLQTFTVPAGTEITVVELIEDMEQDGPVWVESPGTVTEVPVGTATPTAVPTGGADPAPTNINPGDVQPQNTTTPATDKQVWTPTATVTSGTSDFTVKAYREGVDKIVAAINGDTTATNPDITTPAALWNPDTSVTTDALGKLPAPPVITPPAALSALSVTLSLPKIGGTLTSKVISVDFSEYPYATPIAVFRAICLACMAGWFFYISFNAIRSAFAGK